MSAFSHGDTHDRAAFAEGADKVQSDVTWVSYDLLPGINKRVLLSRAPEICLEVLSPFNTRREMAEKKALFFAAGAKEVWFCNAEGQMTFFNGAASKGAKSSRFCPPFPRAIQL